MKRRRSNQNRNIYRLINNPDFTSFQKKVYRAVLAIPTGEVRSYKWVARAIGRPRAFRAVGTALNKNPYTVTIPCHRVIRQDGSIGGYSKGISLKSRLLKNEYIDVKKRH